MESSKFPLDIFPEELQSFIKELKRTNNFAEEFTAMGILYVVGLAIGNSMHVQAKKMWNVNLAIWILFVARSGLGKSPPMKFLLTPIREQDKILNREYKQLLKEFQEYEALSKEEKENREPVQEPKKLKHLFRDFTPERLTQSMEQNKRGIGVHSPEFKEFFNNLDRYSKSGALQMLYSWFDQEPHDRDTLSSDSSFSLPLILLSGGITTKDFNEFRHSKLSGQGFFERMLIVMLTNVKAEYNDEEIKDEYIEYWNGFVNRLLSNEQQIDEFGEPKPKPMKYTEAAKVRLKEWYIKNIEKQNLDCEEYATIYSKQTTYLHKFAGLFNVISAHSKEQERESLTRIGNYSLERAIKLVEYFENKHKEIAGVGIQKNVHRLLKDDFKREVYTRLPKDEPFAKFQVVDQWKAVLTKDRDSHYINDKEKMRIDKNTGNWLKNNKDVLFSRDKHNLYRVLYPDYEF